MMSHKKPMKVLKREFEVEIIFGYKYPAKYLSFYFQTKNQ